MTSEYLKSEINKIMTNKDWSFPLNHAMVAAYILANFKGINLKIFDMTTTGSALCDYNIIATAGNPTQSKAMIDAIASSLRDLGANILSTEGYETADWILVDTGDVIVHVFHEASRGIYDLDMIFAKNAQVKIPDEFYFGKPQEKVETKDSTLKNYF